MIRYIIIIVCIQSIILEINQEMEKWIEEMRRMAQGIDESAWLHSESITEYAALRNLLRRLG